LHVETLQIQYFCPNGIGFLQVVHFRQNESVILSQVPQVTSSFTWFGLGQQELACMCVAARLKIVS